MNRLISKRLYIMEEAGMIAPAEHESLALMVQLLEGEYGIKVAGDNGDIFVSHMAMLMIRHRTGQTVPGIDQAIVQSLQADPRFGPSLYIARSITQACNIEITEQEALYVRMHLCALMMV